MSDQSDAISRMTDCRVAVRVYEAREHDAPRDVDDLGIAGLKPSADRSDRAVGDEDVGALEDFTLGCCRDDRSVAKKGARAHGRH